MLRQPWIQIVHTGLLARRNRVRRIRSQIPTLLIKIIEENLEILSYDVALSYYDVALSYYDVALSYYDVALSYYDVALSYYILLVRRKALHSTHAIY